MQHLPRAVYDFLRPIVESTCQACFSVTPLLLGGMAGTSQIWNQKPTPLTVAVFQIGEPQAGKSRLFAVLEKLFDTCDDVVAKRVQKLLQDAHAHQSQSLVEPRSPWSYHP